MKILINENVHNEILLKENNVYYHGRRDASKHKGNYIYLTDNIGFASEFTFGQSDVMVFKLLFNEQLLFSIKNGKHINLIKKHVDNRMLQAALNASSDELDWSSIDYLSNDDYETGEDLLESLGFKGVILTENSKSKINSIFIFNQKNVKQIGSIPLNDERIKNYYENNN